MANEIKDEVSGVFEATLLEDMMDTVNRVKRPFIDCEIPDVLEKDLHPLTYVPSIFMTYPLKKGDKVLVKFNQDNFRYPVLWKITTEWEDDVVKSIEFPADGTEVKFPDPEKVVSVTKINDGYYVYVTDKYVLVRTGDQFTLLSPSGETTNVKQYAVLAEDIVLETTKEYKLVSKSAISLMSSGTSLVEVGNSVDTLGGIFDELFTKLDNLFTKLGTLHTEGPPTNHTAAAWYGTDIVPIQTEVNLLKQKCAKVFKS